MKSFIHSIFIFTAVVLFISCGDSTQTGDTPATKAKEIISDPLLIEIHDMEARAKTDTVFDRNTGLRLLKAYQEYYNLHAKDSLGQAYLFEAARVADALGKYDKAVELLTNFHDMTGNYHKKAEAAFLVAFIYDAHKKDSEKAIEYYNRVIELYPKSEWAEQAKASLHLVDKSDADLIKFLDEKNKKAS